MCVYCVCVCVCVVVCVYCVCVCPVGEEDAAVCVYIVCVCVCVYLPRRTLKQALAAELICLSGSSLQRMSLINASNQNSLHLLNLA